MLGYTVPSYAMMSSSDLNAYRSCYCESCHQLKDNYGLISAAAVNYDMTFTGIIMNSMSPDGIEKQNAEKGMICVLSRRTADTELLRRIAGYTILLTKWELEDDRADGAGIRSNVARIALGRAIRKAERLYPEYDEHVMKGFEALLKMENDGCTDAVRIGKEFSSYLMPALKDIAGNSWNNDSEKLFTGIGTLVYVMDAVDDLDEDYMNDTFNPFLEGYDGFVNKEIFIRDNMYNITDPLSSVMTDIQSSYSALRGSMRFHHGVADNIIYRGLPDSAKRIMSCACSQRPTLMNMLSSRLLRTEMK